VPWLVPLTAYTTCLPNSPGRLGTITALGYKIPGFLVALLLQQQTASVQAGEKHNASPDITRHVYLQ